MFTKEELLERLDELFPNPLPSLNYNNSFELLVATLLSSRTKDEAVNKITPVLFQKYPNPYLLSKANINDLKEIIKPLGFYNNKAKNLINLSLDLVNKFNGIVPNKKDLLTSLSGVGEKTANVVLVCFFNQPEFPVDTHIKYVSHMLNITNKNDSIKECENKLKSYFKDEDFFKIHLQLLYFGRYLCTKRQKECISFITKK